MCCCDCDCQDERESDTPEMWDGMAQHHRTNDQPISAWYAARVADHLRFYREHVAGVAALKKTTP